MRPLQSRHIGTSHSSPVFVDCSPYTFNVLRCSACAGLPVDHFQLWITIFEVFVPHFYLHCTYCIIPKSCLNHLNSFHRGMFNLNAKFGADSLFYSLGHFECDGHTVHMLTQWHLLPPLISTVKSSLMHVCSSLPSLAAKLH